MAKRKAPDPARSYERAKPEDKAGMGRLDNNEATPAEAPDAVNEAVKGSHPPRGINAEDQTDDRKPAPQPRAAPAAEQPDHSMHEEEPDGWDLAPQDIKDPRHKRHPRTEGRGGTK